MSDVVERLRALTKTRNGRGLDPSQYHLTNPDGPEAADEIERLRKQLDAFESTLRISIWNVAMTRMGMTQDEAIKQVEETIAALKGNQ